MKKIECPYCGTVNVFYPRPYEFHMVNGWRKAVRRGKCECCGLTEWLGEPINLEIHHIDGNHNNNELENIQLLCPNCHSYTDNYCGKNINTGKIKVEDEALVEALNNSSSIRQALISVGLAGSGGNYKRANELIVKYQITKFLN